jgi:glutamate--cysteine ligase
MNYKSQINTYVNYFENAESKKECHKIGVEFEHLILNADLTALSYFEKMGIEELLEELAKNNAWEEIYEGEHLVGLNSEHKAVTLEPGGQLELSIIPFSDLKQIEKIYLDFIDELKSILNKWDKKIAVLGYQPASKIKDIPLLPKKRYDFMYKYFKDKGKYAHNMMKGTASVQMSIDYINEKDYIKKMRVGYFLSPLIYYLFDNTPFFEGKKAANASIREDIWTKCDQQRSGTINGIFDKEFGYSDYAAYLLNTEPIIRKKDNELIYTGNKTLKNVMENDNPKEIDHFLSMVFPDVRTKKYIEIRAADALPYPYNFSFVALLKNIFYNQENLDYLYQLSLNYNQEDFLNFNNKMINDKKNNQRSKLIAEILKRAKNNASKSELKYLNKFEKTYLKYGPLKFKTLANLEKGKEKALEWCFLN